MLSCVWLLVTPWTIACQDPLSMKFWATNTFTLHCMYCSSDSKDCLQCRRPGFNPRVGKFPWRREWLPTPVFLPGKSHGERSLVGYSPRGHKELDTTEWLIHTHTHTDTHTPCCTVEHFKVYLFLVVGNIFFRLSLPSVLNLSLSNMVSRSPWLTSKSGHFSQAIFREMVAFQMET